MGQNEAEWTENAEIKNADLTAADSKKHENLGFVLTYTRYKRENVWGRGEGEMG